MGSRSMTKYIVQQALNIFVDRTCLTIKIYNLIISVQASAQNFTRQCTFRHGLFVLFKIHRFTFGTQIPSKQLQGIFVAFFVLWESLSTINEFFKFSLETLAKLLSVYCVLTGDVNTAITRESQERRLRCYVIGAFHIMRSRNTAIKINRAV